MKNKLEMKWLKERGISLEQEFVSALKNMAQIYKKANNITNVEKVYGMLGVKKQYLSYWGQNPYSLSSKKNFVMS